MEYLAHSQNEAGEYHYLAEHLRMVAENAANSISDQNLKKLAYFAGLWHDLGKVNPDFQRKLIKNTNEYVDHKGFGFFLAKKFHSEFLQYVIAGHHGGLSNPEEIDIWGREILDQGHINQIVADVLELLNKFTKPDDELAEIEQYFKSGKDLIIRMIFSALVDADFLDTEKHFNATPIHMGEDKTLNKSFWSNFQHYHQKLIYGKEGKLNLLRQKIFLACIHGAENKPGFFRLTVPTGGGKTLSSLGFALKHAIKYSKERIIYAIPYTSIIEQTAGEFKKIFPTNTVLEHHTGIHTLEEKEYNNHEIWNRIASENWSAPIIITTTVQFFESLTARSTSKCRKLHNIQNSVIVVDEVQTLPMELLPTIMDLLKELVQRFEATIIFCTATQPALDSFLEGSSITPTELAPNPAKLFRQLTRVKYYNHSQEKWSWPTIIAEMKKAERVMVVVNTKKDAKTLWETFNDETTYHLSTALCGAHRKDILDEIRSKLKNKERCYLVSTQVIEAGVDIDFDRVLRAIGPLDRIVQAAGRCNREGNLDYGKVLIINPDNGSFPMGSYGAALHKAGQLLNNPDIQLDLNNPDTFPVYFAAVRKNITERTDIEQYRRQLKFKTIAEKFKMIPEKTLPVIVKYHPEKVNSLLDLIKYAPGKAIRELQPYLVNLYPWEIKKFQNLMKEVFPGLYLWLGKYHNRLGLLKEIDLKGLVY